MYVSYLKTLMKTELCSYRVFSFCTLNGHILLLKRDYEMRRYLEKIML